MIKYIQKILFLLFILSSTFLFAQTPGFNYQALILNNTEIQIPGADITENKIPLSLEDVTLRFTITNADGVEYTEEHTVTTDENGMVSLIVGEGTPVEYTFDNVNWDGYLKYLNVELDILNNNEGFTFLDSQKILYIPHPSNGTSTVRIVADTTNLTPPFVTGDIVWVSDFGPNGNPTLIIWNGTNWVPVNNDIDPTNELGLIVVADATERDNQFTNPVIGDQVWNQSCSCIEVFNGSIWISSAATGTDTLNGLYKDGTTIKLGGNLTEPTEIVTSNTNTLAIKFLEDSNLTDNEILVTEKETGILRTMQLTSIVQQEQSVVLATDGQLQFTTPIPITSIDKIEVYRNGARIDFTAVNTTTIEVEPEAVCYKDDKIRIVQLY